MPDMLNNAVSGLLTFQRALSTTSHNIANVNTPGYSRQQVEIGTMQPTFFGDNFHGNGVGIESIERAYDQFLTREMRDSTSVYSRLEKFSDLSSRIDDLLADPQGGVAPMLNDFFSALQDIADDPSSLTSRYAMIDMASTLASRFENMDSRLEELAQNTATNIGTVVGEINSLVNSIREVNFALNESYAFGSGSQQSGDLRDRRDSLLGELAEKVDITVINEQDNHLSIFIGNGQTILSGTEAFSLSARPDSGDPSRDVIVYNGLITVNDISSHLTGGELGGLLEFRANVLEPTQNALGRSAIGLAETFNAQMRDGMDLNGNLGQDFFAYTPPESFGHATNVGTATVNTIVSDVSALTTDNYGLSFDGANWTLTSDSGSSASVANGAPATLVFEGLTLTINGATASIGDQFTIKPTQGASGGLQVLIRDPAEIAAALPIRTSAPLSNLGSMEISAGSITDVTNPALLTTATFTFDTPASSFRSDVNVVVGGTAYAAGAAIPFSNNMVVDANGWQVSLNGAAQPNDILTVQANTGGVGDNRNALNLAGLQNSGIFDGGISNFQEDYGNLIGRVGSQVVAANVERDAQQTLLFQAIERQSSTVGVNLDEEAADLIRFQQAYEATARIISSVQTMFETLLSSVR